MQELSLYGQVPKDVHERVLSQLAGFARMQPQHFVELRLVFRARTPSGIERVQSAGGSQGVQQQDMQRLKTMLSGGLYYLQLVGAIQKSNTATTNGSEHNTDVEMTDGDQPSLEDGQRVRWTLEFKDTPESGKQTVSTRLMSRTSIEDGDPIAFMDHFGYEYVSRYVLRGARFYDQDTTLSLSQACVLPNAESGTTAADIPSPRSLSDLQPFDGSGSYLLQASIEVADGNNQDLKDRAIKQLIQMRDTLRPSVVMTPGDRLALDTRIPKPLRRG